MSIKIIQKQISEILDDSTAPPRKFEFGSSLAMSFSFGYDSNRDGDCGEFHFSAQAAEEIWDFLHKKFPHLKLENFLDADWMRKN